MRAFCETCGQVQPPDWKPGDLCGHCGAVVRREKRCHWCVQLTPAGKFCRHCGAGQVLDEQFGAARWLKHLGSDQFVIPDRLTSMDPEQVEHFTRLYQRHAIVAERHIDDLAYTEEFARRRGWARALEEELLPRLPLPDNELKSLSLPALRGTTDAEKLLEIREASPFSFTRYLAALARLRQWQAREGPFSQEVSADWSIAAQAVNSGDEQLREEAAITLSHWRFVMSGAPAQSGVVSALYAASSSSMEAAVNRALIEARSRSEAQPVPTSALAAEDSNLAFAAALAGHAPDPLLASLRVPVRRFAAAYTLTLMNVDFALAPLLLDFTPDELDDVLRILAWRKRPRPDLRQFLSAAANGEHNVAPHVRKVARELLVLDLHPGDAVRLVQEQPEGSFITKVLEAAAAVPGEVVAVCRKLVALDLFYPPQLSILTTLINQNKLTLSFLPDTFQTAPPTSVYGLIMLARQQFNTYEGHELLALHTFLCNLMWDEAATLELRRHSRRLLEEWYRGNPNGRQPLKFTQESATAYFGSFKAYLDHFLYGLEHPAVLIDLEAGHDFLRPLEDITQPAAASALIEGLLTLPPAMSQRLRTALVDLAGDEAREWNPRKWAIQVLGQLQQYPPWREGVRAELASLQTTDLDFMVDEVLSP